MPKLRRQKRHLKSLSGNRFPSRTESHVSPAEAVSPTARTESRSPEVFGRQPSPDPPRAAEMTDEELGDITPILESSVTAIEELDLSTHDDSPEILPFDSPKELVESTEEPLEEELQQKLLSKQREPMRLHLDCEIARMSREDILDKVKEDMVLTRRDGTKLQVELQGLWPSSIIESLRVLLPHMWDMSIRT